MNENQIFSVSDVSMLVRSAIDTEPRLREIRLRGEIGSLTTRYATMYFTVKDELSQIRCAMWPQNVRRLSMQPKVGDRVVLSGSVSVYEKNTELQFVATDMRPDGVGNLYLQLEAIKARLTAEGLFDTSRKRRLPWRPRKIAVVTSAGGAVIHDILKVTGQRDPSVPIVLVPSAVQGAGAANQLVQALHVAGSLPGVDVVIIGRGGGSMEDLWCFNDEALARAVAACPVPVVSAVGHETDTTLCDYAADARAATPSQAAEMAVPDIRLELNKLTVMRNRMTGKARDTLQMHRKEAERLRALLETNRPENRLDQLKRRQTDLRHRLDLAMDGALTRRLPEPARLRERLLPAGERVLERKTMALKALRVSLDAVAPMRVLERGYAMVMDETGVPVTGAAAARTLPALRLQFADGSVRVKPEENKDNG